MMLLHGDCLQLMHQILDGGVDMILADLPYGTTACKWDNVIPFEPLWKHYWRVLKPNGAVVLFGSEPFSSHLRMSQIKHYKYDWIWHKTQATGHLNCQKQPMRCVELISVFYQKQCRYIPQITNKAPKDIRPRGRGGKSDCYNAFDTLAPALLPPDKSYPRQVLHISNANHGERGYHPTQKPVALLEYLIKTYTLEGEIVLDNTMGSGSTGVACVNTNRKFIGIEQDEKYFKIAQERIRASSAR